MVPHEAPPLPALIQPAPLATSSRLGLPTSSYARGVAGISRVMSAESTLPLQAGAGTRAWVHRDRPAKGTLIMYHGFTAGTWQFAPLAAKCYAAGYNVYVPRLPGHGLKDAQGVEDPSRLLTGRSWGDYEAFADRTVAEAQALGGPVSVLGLSVGANVALAAAERHPEIKKVVAYAPFLWPKHDRVQMLFRATRAADFLTHRQAGAALDGMQHSWGEACRLETASGQRPGHSYFFASNAYGATELGHKVIDQAPRMKATLQLFATAVDDAAEEGAIRTLYQRAGGAQRHGFYYYPAAEGVPHPMVHPSEDKGRGHTPALYEMTLKFLETGAPLNREEQ